VPNLPTLTQDEWLSTFKRLTLFAIKRFQLCGWYSGPGNQITAPGGVGPEDIASEAIQDVIDGRRNYDAQKCPNFLRFLKGVVSSKISHLVESLDSAPVRYFVGHIENDDGSSSDSYSEESNCSGDEPDPAKLCMDREFVSRIKIFIKEQCQKDELVFKIMECLEADITKPAEMADVLGVNVSEINNAQKRLRRQIAKLEPLQKEYCS
jgi:hypothetical protein